MKKNLAGFLPVLALSFLAACGGAADAASKAVGTYALDVDALIASVPEMKAAPAEMLAEMKKKMTGTIELKADMTAAFTFDMGMPMMPKQSETGTWKLEGTTLEMMTKKGETNEKKTAKLENGTITVEEENGGKKMTMVFKKK